VNSRHATLNEQNKAIVGTQFAAAKVVVGVKFVELGSVHFEILAGIGIKNIVHYAGDRD
jgi:hypothetical protein